MLFATPLVFAFAAESQFALVAADRDVLTGKVQDENCRLARNLVHVTQTTGLLCGTAVRRRDMESCLVSIPVEQPEKSSGRNGLAVVLGVVTSTKAHVSPRMYHEMLQAVLVPRLLELLPVHGDRSLRGWAEALTHEYQTLGSGVLSGQSEGEVVRVARLYTSLINGYGSDALGDWATASAVDDVLLVAQTQVECLGKSGKDQFAFLMPLAESDAMPVLGRKVTTHRIVGDDVLICVTGSMHDVFEGS